jgi:hypothetical protein|tara:strand:- start:14232 stop:14627 length:396 start_codon:yes stop_codon:yes gene_type:complete
MTSISIKFDKAAISFSALCIAHCLLLPIGLALLPSVAIIGVLSDELFHYLLLVLIIPTSLAALSLGCRLHKSWLVFLLGAAGMSILILTAFFAHDFLGEQLEKVATIFGAILIAASHALNFSLCRRKECGP